MKKFILILLIVSLASCSYTKRLNKWCKRCPETVQHDTIKIQHDSVVYKDSVIEVTLPQLPADTIQIPIPCQGTGAEWLNIAVHHYKYDYVTVDVWVTNNVLGVKPYLNNDKINILVKNARVETYQKLYERYKDFHAIKVTEKYIPWWFWFMWGFSLVLVFFIVALLVGARR